MLASACRALPPPRRPPLATHRYHRAVLGFTVAGRAALPVLRQPLLPPSQGLRAPSGTELALPAAAAPVDAHTIATVAIRSSFPVVGRLRRAGSTGETIFRGEEPDPALGEPDSAWIWPTIAAGSHATAPPDLPSPPPSSAAAADDRTSACSHWRPALTPSSSGRLPPRTRPHGSFGGRRREPRGRRPRRPPALPVTHPGGGEAGNVLGKGGGGARAFARVACAGGDAGISIWPTIAAYEYWS